MKLLLVIKEEVAIDQQFCCEQLKKQKIMFKKMQTLDNR